MEIKDIFDKLTTCHGFEQMSRAMYDFKYGWCGYGMASVAYRVGDYVIKHSLQGGECHRPEGDALNNPLIARLWLPPVYQSKYVIVQHFCEPLEARLEERVIKIIHRIMGDNKEYSAGFRSHIHRGNFGRYGGKIKMFDAI